MEPLCKTVKNQNATFTHVNRRDYGGLLIFLFLLPFFIAWLAPLRLSAGTLGSFLILLGAGFATYAQLIRSPSRIVIFSDGTVVRSQRDMLMRMKRTSISLDAVVGVASYGLGSGRASISIHVVLLPKSGFGNGRRWRSEQVFELANYVVYRTIRGFAREGADAETLRNKFAQASGVQDLGFFGWQYARDNGDIRPYQKGARELPTPDSPAGH